MVAAPRLDGAAARARALVAFREREAMGLPKKPYACRACDERTSPPHNRRTCPVVNYGPEPLWVRGMRAAGRSFRTPARVPYR